MKVQVDGLYKGQGYGSLAQKLLAHKMNVNALRPWIETDAKGNEKGAYMTVNGEAVPINNATLRKDEWKQYDQALLPAARERLVGIADLQARGLVYNITNGLGTTVLEYEDIGDIEAAQVSMDAVTRGRRDRPEFDINYLPLPIIHSDFYINIRVLNASRTTGQPLDTTMAELAARKVAEKAEEHLFLGADTFIYGGGIIYGYEDFPSANTITLSVNWDASAKTGEQIVGEVRDMKQASIDDRYYGPWVLYIPTSYETVMDDDYVSGYPKTIRERILEIDGIQDVKVVDSLSDDHVILVQMTSNVVRLVQGLGITTVEWDTEGGMVSNYKVMTIMVPQLRADQNGRTGIVVLS
jgi:uncharacterized linocin/CFP29 family protein